ncbi:MAG: GAF domain-containing protein [Chloroflexota bacterium]
MSENINTNSSVISDQSAKLSSLLDASLAMASMDSSVDILAAGLKSIQDYGYLCAIYHINDDGMELSTELTQRMKLSRQIPSRLSIGKQDLNLVFPNSNPILVEDIFEPVAPIPQPLLMVPKQMGCNSAGYIAMRVDQKLHSLFILGSQEKSMITEGELAPLSKIVIHVGKMLEKLGEAIASNEIMNNMKKLAQIGQETRSENNLQKLFEIGHEQVRALVGDVAFHVALFDEGTQHISFPYIYELGKLQQIDSIPLGDGLTSVVIRDGNTVMLVENAQEQAIALGAKLVGPIAKSWLGVPLKFVDKIIGAISIQDTDREHRFSESNRQIMETLAAQISGAINNSRLVEEAQKHIIQLDAASQIARETSGTTDKELLLNQTVQMVMDRFGYYHAGIYLISSSGGKAVIEAGTGKAGRRLVEKQHSFEVGSQSVVGHVTASGSPLIVNDNTDDPLFNYNPLLPDTKAELGIPLKIGPDVIGLLDIQSTQPYAFSENDVEILQILADQLSVTIRNAELIEVAQNNLSKQRIVQQVTKFSASATSLNKAVKITVDELHAALGLRISVLLLEPETSKLQVVAAAGYANEILGMEIDEGEGITGWAADTRNPVIVGSVLDNPRYISSDDDILSELALPIIFRDELFGVLNIESDEKNAFSEVDQEIFSTVASLLAAVMVNTRLSERQRQLYDVTNNIRRSVDMESILKTTASELSRVLKTRKTKIEIGIEEVTDAPRIVSAISSWKGDIQ